jgi:hypothetical protein
VSSPDSTRPSEKPLAPNTVYTLNARFRIGPSGNVVVSSDMLAGAVKAAAIPLMKRAPISSAGLLTTPPSSETTANTASAAMNTRRRPDRRQGDTDHGHVKRVQAQRPAQYEQDPPQLGSPAIVRRSHARNSMHVQALDASAINALATIITHC